MLFQTAFALQMVYPLQEHRMHSLPVQNRG
jgi:hypothetical protein